MLTKEKSAERWGTVLDILLRKVREAETPQEKFAIATQKFSKKAIHTDNDGFGRKAEAPQEIFVIATQKFSEKAIQTDDAKFDAEQAIQVEPEDRYDETHGLAIAISLANVEACGEFLALFDDEEINSSKHFVFGYKQLYSMLHVALDPRGHLGIDFDSEDDATENLRQIIELLAKKGANPNAEILTEGSMYSNPAMAGGVGRGGGSLAIKNLLTLGAQLVLAGADPGLLGTSHELHESNQTEIIRLAFSFFQQAGPEEKRAFIGRLHPSVKGRFQESVESAIREMQDLSSLLASGNPSNDAADQEKAGPNGSALFKSPDNNNGTSSVPEPQASAAKKLA